MRKYLIFVLLLIFGFSLSGEVCVAREDEYSGEEEYIGENGIYYTQGVVDSLDTNTRKLVVREYMNERRAWVSSDYQIDLHVEVENMFDWWHLKNGSRIEFEYEIDENEEKIIKYIYLIER